VFLEFASASIDEELLQRHIEKVYQVFDTAVAALKE
jgi:hypothetical protein